MAELADAALRLQSVSKTYGTASGDIAAVQNVTVEFGRGQFITILGPSGCGKTTILKMIAGFESVTSGSVFMNGQDIAHLAPEQRPINTVFQNYALFPHLSVAENIAFGLRRLKRPAEEVRRRTDEMLELVKMEPFRALRPGNLSGGQQQRVALARALAPSPRIVLLDEPLAALDLKLRQALRSELKLVQQATKSTFIFVTHDQEEALSMSDSVVVMHGGRVQQTGRPVDIYRRPNNRFVAGFIGDTNFIPAKVEGKDAGKAMCRTEAGRLISATGIALPEVGSDVTLSIRPEDIRVGPARGADDGEVVASDFLGGSISLQVAWGQTVVNARSSEAARGWLDFRRGDPVTLEIAPSTAWIVEA